MNIYPRLVALVGAPAADLAVIALRGVLIALVVLMSDKGFTTFSYLKL